MGLSRKAAHFVLIVGLILVTAFAHGSSPECERDATLPATIAVNLILEGHRLQVLTEEDLNAFATGMTEGNPFKPHKQKLNGHNLFLGFQRILRVASETQITIAKRLIEQRLVLLAQQRMFITSAVEHIRQVLVGPTFLRSLKIPDPSRRSWGAPQISQNALQGEFEGRPVIVAVLEDKSRDNSNALVLYDPFHPEANQQVHVLQFGGKEIKLEYAHIVDIKGTPYYVDLDSKDAFNLKTKEKIAKSLLGFASWNANYFANYISVQSKDGPLLLEFEPHSGISGPKILKVYSFNRPLLPPKVFPQELCNRPLLHAAAGRHFVTCIHEALGIFRIYDVEAAEFLDFQPPLDKSIPQMHSFIYSDGGKIYFASFSAAQDVHPTQMKEYWLKRTDLENKNDVKNIAKTSVRPTIMESFEDKGAPYVYYGYMGDLEAISLRDGSIHRLDTQFPANFRNQFEWKGRPYSLMSIGGGEAFVADLKSGYFTGRYQSPSVTYYNRTFWYEGRLYAFIGGLHTEPELLKITSEEPR